MRQTVAIVCALVAFGIGVVERGMAQQENETSTVDKVRAAELYSGWSVEQGVPGSRW
jgi:hypothetical protein